MAQNKEYFEVEIALDPGFNEFLINNRYAEVKDAAPYLKYRGAVAEPIKLFRIAGVTRDDLKEISRIVLDETCGWGFLTFSVNGLIKRKHDGITELLYNIEPDAVSREKTKQLAERLAAALKDQEFAGSLEVLPDGIQIATSDKFGEVESVLSAAGEKLSFADRLLLSLFRLPFFAGRLKTPSYKPRKFCARLDLTELTIFADGKRYKTFDLTCDNLQYRQVSDPRHSRKEEYARYRRLKGIESGDYGDTYAVAVAESPDTDPANNAGSVSADGTVYLISDLHLNHADIIRTTARPFADRDIEEMNRVLIENWRGTVKDGDRIIYLGDLTYKADEETADRFLGMLSGNLTFVEGNHDKNVNRDLVGSVSDYTFEYKGYRFYCVHNPKFAPKDFAGWIIHGHTHNTRMCRYPFVNMKERTINVSCEVIGYRPVSIDTIIGAIERCRDEKRERADYPEDIV